MNPCVDMRDSVQRRKKGVIEKLIRSSISTTTVHKSASSMQATSTQSVSTTVIKTYKLGQEERIQRIEPRIDITSVKKTTSRIRNPSLDARHVMFK